MSQVLRNSNETPQIGAKLEGLVERLLSLRAEIDSALAELQMHTASALAATAKPIVLADRLAELDQPAEQHAEASGLALVDDDARVIPLPTPECDPDPVADLYADTSAAEEPALSAEREFLEYEATSTPDAGREVAEDTVPPAAASLEQAPIASMPAEAEIAAPAPVEPQADDDLCGLTVDPGTACADAPDATGTPGTEITEATAEAAEEAERANAAARLAEARIISLQEHRLKNKSAPAAPSPKRARPRRARYLAATVATGLAASLGFAIVMLADIDELRAGAAASESLRTFIEHTKRHFEPRHEAIDTVAGTTAEVVTDHADALEWIRVQHMWPVTP
jgi:hypothetical protein